jgi:hypothetical protein
VLVALHATGIAQPLQFKQARAVAADSEFYPDLPHARNVALPDDWAMSRPGETGPVWYRVTFDAENARANGELMALYIERACSSVAVLLNGKLIHVSGRLTEPVSRNCQRPQLISLPGALITQSQSWQGILPTLQESLGLQGNVKWSSWVEINPRAAESDYSLVNS